MELGTTGINTVTTELWSQSKKKNGKIYRNLLVYNIFESGMI